MTTTPSSGDPFVGRERELDELSDALARAMSGNGKLVLLAGEPGIGKTRLADELASRAAARGARVIWGRCWQGGGAPAFWLWVQVVRALVHELSEDDLARHGVSLDDMRRFTMEPVLAAADGEVALGGDPEQARFRFFEAVSTCLRLVAERQPLLLVLDDLHWATGSSLLLLRYVARSLRDSRILVIGTYRDADVRLQPEIATLVGELVREGKRLALVGLVQEQVAHFVGALAGRRASDKLVESIYRITEGNPFFVDEIVRLLLAEARAQSLPQGVLIDLRLPDEVRDVIRRRIEPLSAGARELLACAAVIGREFDTPLLEEIDAADARSGRVIDLVAAAARAGVVVESPERPGRFRFAHGLIRDVLYEWIEPAHRSRLHLRVGNVLATAGAGRERGRLAEIAHHLCCAAPEGDLAVAIEYAERAGREALRLLAYEEAASAFHEALRALNLGARGDVRETALTRVELLLSLGDARWRFGDMPRATEAYAQAIDVSRRFALDEPFARAAHGLGKVKIERAAMDPQFVLTLEEALQRCPAHCRVLRVHLLARLATALQYGGDALARDALARDAVALAREVDDRAALAAALSAKRSLMWQPGSAERRAAISTEVIELALASGDAELELAGRQMLISDQLELGNLAVVDGEIGRFAEVAGSRRLVRFSRYALVFQAMRALLDGRLDEAEERIENALRAREAEATPSSYYLTQMVRLRYDQGTLFDYRQGLEEFARRAPEQRIFRCGLALAYVEGGDLESARSLFETLARFGFVDFPYDGNWLVCMGLLTQACVALGDVARAATLYDLLQPAAQHHIVVVGGVAYWGSVEHALGLLAATLGRPEHAGEHLDRAVAVYAAIGARPCLARAWRDIARLRPDDDGRQARAAAQQAAAEMGMRGLSAAVAPPAPPAAERAIAPASHAEEFRRMGDVWNLRFADQAATVEDGKGLRYLAHLLRHPGVEMHATDLVGLSRANADEVQARTLRQLARSDAGEILDARATGEYKRRLKELRAELEEAEACYDLARQDRLQEEIEFLTRELAAALGLGGRRRKAGSPAERARVNVTKVIRAALDKIRAVHPALGAHLDRTIRTGTFCAYQPELDRLPDWLF